MYISLTTTHLTIPLLHHCPSFERFFHSFIHQASVLFHSTHSLTNLPNMRCTYTFLLTSALNLATASPLSSRAIATFPKGTVWDIVLDSSSVTLSALKSASGTVIDIDMFDNVSKIKELAKTKQVICYFSAGTREDWRDDADDFKAANYGKAMEDWKGENWVDVKSTNVRAIMKKRIEFAAKNGCTAVDPDNVDGYGVRPHVPSSAQTYKPC